METTESSSPSREPPDKYQLQREAAQALQQELQLPGLSFGSSQAGLVALNADDFTTTSTTIHEASPVSDGVVPANARRTTMPTLPGLGNAGQLESSRAALLDSR